MDLVKAILSLSDLKDQMSYEEVMEAKELVKKIESDMGDLALFLQRHDMGESENFVSLILNWDKMKDELVSYFE